MAEISYALCALTSIFCAVLLVRSYRATRQRLLLWSSLGFVGFALNNILVFVDIVLLPEVDLSPARNIAALLGALALVTGLAWERP